MAESHGNAKNMVKATFINADFNNRKLAEQLGTRNKLQEVILKWLKSQLQTQPSFSFWGFRTLDLDFLLKTHL